jgi:hypothetical protein
VDLLMKFRGTIVHSKWESTWPLREFFVNNDALYVPRTWRTNSMTYPYSKSVFWIEKIRPPLGWRDVVFVQLVSFGSSSRLGLIPWRRRQFLRALADAGVDVQASDPTG